MNSINKLSRFAGVLIIFTIGLVSAQITDTLKLGGNFYGDVPTPTKTTVTSLPGNRGGGTQTSSGFYFTNLSPLWSGTIHMAAVTGGFSYTAQDTLIRNMNKSTILNITVKDTGRPEIIIQKPLPNAVLTTDKMDSIKTRVRDNSNKVKSIQADFSLDSGKTWDSVGRKTTPNYFMVGISGIGTPFDFPFTPKKASDSCIIRVIVRDYFQGNADTAYVSVKILPVTKVRPNFVNRSTIQNSSTDFYDISGRRIIAGKSTKFYAIRTAGVTRTKINLR